MYVYRIHQNHTTRILCEKMRTISCCYTFRTTQHETDTRAFFFQRLIYGIILFHLLSVSKYMFPIDMCIYYGVFGVSHSYRHGTSPGIFRRSVCVSFCVLKSVCLWHVYAKIFLI